MGKDTHMNGAEANSHHNQPSASYGLSNAQNSLERRPGKDNDNCNRASNCNNPEHIVAMNNQSSNDHLLDTMVDWLENVPENELYVIESNSSPNKMFENIDRLFVCFFIFVFFFIV